MSWLLVADVADPDTLSTIADWVKITAGGLTISGLIWACVYVARLIWQTQTVVQKNVIEDNVRLRQELKDRSDQHRIEIQNKDLLITKRDELIDRLRKDIRKSDDETNKVEDDNRELRFENAKLRDQGKGSP